MAENVLTPEMQQAIDKELKKYPADKRRSASLSAIRIVQDLGNHSVTQMQLDAIADYLGEPKIAIYEVASFYTMCKRKPIGKHNIGVCTNVSCMLNGADKVVEHLNKRLDIKFGGTTKDGCFSLEEVECLGACVNAPMFQVNKDYYERLTPEKIDKILEELQED